jgi:uncharacterized phage protein gp47/JayE
MAASFAELIKPASKDVILEKILNFMQLAGFNTTSWQPGAFQRTLVEAEAEYFADESASIAQIATGGFPQLATSDFLDQVGEGFFATARNEAVFTRGYITLTDAGDVGPFNLTAGQLWVADATRTYRYNTLAGGTLPLGGTLSLEVQAESSGAAYNLGNNTIVDMVTPLPGVTITNPSRGSLSWISQQGTDRETDAAYATRMVGRWSTLGTGSNETAYRFYATSASAEVTRAAVSENQATGHVTVTVAGAAGPISSAAVADVDTLLQARRPLGVTVITSNAAASNTLIGGTVFIEPSYDITATIANVGAALSAYAQTAPIGSNIYRAQLTEVIMGVAGVYNVTLSAPASDVMLASNNVFVPTLSLVGSR